MDFGLAIERTNRYIYETIIDEMVKDEKQLLKEIQETFSEIKAICTNMKRIIKEREERLSCPKPHSRYVCNECLMNN